MRNSPLLFLLLLLVETNRDHPACFLVNAANLRADALTKDLSSISDHNNHDADSFLVGESSSDFHRRHLELKEQEASDSDINKKDSDGTKSLDPKNMDKATIMALARAATGDKKLLKDPQEALKSSQCSSYVTDLSGTIQEMMETHSKKQLKEFMCNKMALEEANKKELDMERDAKIQSDPCTKGMELKILEEKSKLKETLSSREACEREIDEEWDEWKASKGKVAKQEEGHRKLFVLIALKIGMMVAFRVMMVMARVGLRYMARLVVRVGIRLSRTQKATLKKSLEGAKKIWKKSRRKLQKCAKELMREMRHTGGNIHRRREVKHDNIDLKGEDEKFLHKSKDSCFEWCLLDDDCQAASYKSVSRSRKCVASTKADLKYPGGYSSNKYEAWVKKQTNELGGAHSSYSLAGRKFDLGCSRVATADDCFNECAEDGEDPEYPTKLVCNYAEITANGCCKSTASVDTHSLQFKWFGFGAWHRESKLKQEGYEVAYECVPPFDALIGTQGTVLPKEQCFENCRADKKCKSVCHWFGICFPSKKSYKDAVDYPGHMWVKGDVGKGIKDLFEKAVEDNSCNV